jgi:hypothetical protein
MEKAAGAALTIVDEVLATVDPAIVCAGFYQDLEQRWNGLAF